MLNSIFCSQVLSLNISVRKIILSLYCLYLVLNKENRIYIRVEFRQSLGMNFVSPFQPEKGVLSVQFM